MYDLGFSKCEMGRKVWGLMGVAYPRFLGFEGGGLTGLGGVPGLSLLVAPARAERLIFSV